MSGRKCLTIILAVLACCMDSVAAQFGMSWIAHPQPDSTSQVWFRNTYTTTGRPQRSCITVATTGYVQLFVNGRNVSTEALAPFRHEPSAKPLATTYDVTRFMRADSNTVAVWYSPAVPHMEKRQIAVDFHGKDKDGNPFCHSSGNDWICRRASTSLNTDGKESTDATAYGLKWNSADYAPACWLNAAESGTQPDEPTETRQAWYEAARTWRIRQQQHFDIEGDSIVYDFGAAFHGMLRVTLRGTRRGQRINIGGMRYTCCGEPDEQAIQRFTTTNARRIMICGDERFNIEHIRKVEVMELDTYTHGFRN